MQSSRTSERFHVQDFSDHSHNNIYFSQITVVYKPVLYSTEKFLYTCVVNTNQNFITKKGFSASTIHVLKKQNINFITTLKIPITSCAYCKSHRSFRWVCGGICYSTAINQEVSHVLKKKIERAGGSVFKSNSNVLPRSVLTYAWDGDRV